MAARSIRDLFRLSTGGVGIQIACEELKAGEYKLKVEGSQATFTDQDSKSITVAVKIENVARKFAATTVETTSAPGDMDNITAIDLAGSTTKLEFGQ